jgi:hypothetical protein
MNKLVKPHSSTRILWTIFFGYDYYLGPDFKPEPLSLWDIATLSFVTEPADRIAYE